MDGRVTYEWTDVWVYEWTDVWACVRALTCSLVTCARTYENKVDSSRPYFCTFRLFLTYLVLGRFRHTEIRSTRVDLIFVRGRARDEWTCQLFNARTYAHTSVDSYKHFRPLVRHASVPSYAYTYAGSYARPSPRSSALVTRRTLSKITTFYETLQKLMNSQRKLGSNTSVLRTARIFWDLKWWRVVRDWDLTLMKGGVRLYHT